MMNEVHLEGEVKITWTYDGTLYARLSLRRDDTRNRREHEKTGGFDYITAAFPGSARRGLAFHAGQQLVVHGWLQSRDYTESLQTFLQRAGDVLDAAEAARLPQVAVRRTATEVVVERWQVVRRTGRQNRKTLPVLPTGRQTQAGA